MRLTFVGELPAFVMLSEAKHLGGEWNQRLFSCLAQILRWRSEPALSVAEGMTGGDDTDPTKRSRTRTGLGAKFSWNGGLYLVE